MTLLELLERSGIPTLPGTGLVILLLIIRILVVMRVDKFITSRLPEKPQETTAAPTHFGAYAAGDGGAITAAISAAVNEYRKLK
jgi:oxaloacetate decarboxylase gamma subunit